jgi:hypothetical protein
VHTGYRKDAFDAAFGVLYDVIDYIDGGESDYTDYESLRMNADLSCPLWKKKISFIFSMEWPFPGFTGKNTVSDKSLSAELEYRL